MNWQPIETAPRDRVITVWNVVMGAYTTQYHDGEWPLFANGGGKNLKPSVWFPQPTHWMALPEPPQAGT